MSNPLAGPSVKPILGREGSDHHFVGRVIIELFEGPHIASDADGFVISISPALGSNLSQQELLNRIAAALPRRAAMRERTNPEKAREKYIQDHQ
ncbi:MAG: hypothetical protein WCD86_10515 [Ktedonobacteraceae bacterium]